MIIIAILLVLTAALVVLHLTTRDQVPEESLAVHIGETAAYMDFSALQPEVVNGTVINGKR